MRTRLTLLLALLLLLPAAVATTAASAAVESTYEPIRETGVRLIVPEGFRVATEFSGLGRDEDLTSILVTELPFPIAIAQESFTPEALARRGLTLHRRGRVEVDGHDAMLLHASQEAAGMEFRKWLVVFGDDHSSVLITATTPLEFEARHQEALVETLRTARWSPQRESPTDTTLPFAVGEPPPLRIVTSGPNVVVLTDPSRTDEGGAPVLSVGMSRAQVQIGDVAAFARTRLEESVTIDRIEILTEKPRELAGMPGHQLEADAHDTATGRPVRVFQLLATDGARYTLLQGIVDRGEAESFGPLFEAVVESFSLRPPG